MNDERHNVSRIQADRQLRYKAGTAYHYFMEAAEVKKEGIEI